MTVGCVEAKPCKANLRSGGAAEVGTRVRVSSPSSSKWTGRGCLRITEDRESAYYLELARMWVVLET